VTTKRKIPDPKGASTNISGFAAYHRARNAALGLWELDVEMKALQAELTAVQEQIIQGCTVRVALAD
jgi:hypothetical protein